MRSSTARAMALSPCPELDVAGQGDSIETLATIFAGARLFFESASPREVQTPA